jgi:uncharacterized LabA/DUF88 family protein
MKRRVAVFIDLQNSYHCARDAFIEEFAPSRLGNFSPLGLADLLASKGSGPYEVVFIGVYVGAPDPRKDAKGASAQSRRVAAWEAESDLVKVKSRGLRYPPGRPLSDAEEKGIDVQLAIDAMVMGVRDKYDVAILATADTDLLPVVEGLLALKALNGKPEVEVIGWKGLSRGLVTAGVQMRWVGDKDFAVIRDDRDYNVRSN